MVKATIPGIKTKDLEVTATDGTLVIKGETGEEHESKEEHYLLRERRRGSFHRAIALPENLDTDKTEAVFEDGVLTITLPKTERARAKKA